MLENILVSIQSHTSNGHESGRFNYRGAWHNWKRDGFAQTGMWSDRVPRYAISREDNGYVIACCAMDNDKKQFIEVN